VLRGMEAMGVEFPRACVAVPGARSVADGAEFGRRIGERLALSYDHPTTTRGLAEYAGRRIQLGVGAGVAWRLGTLGVSSVAKGGCVFLCGRFGMDRGRAAVQNKPYRFAASGV